MSSVVTACLTPSLMLLMTSLFGTNGKRELLKKCGPLTKHLSCKISAEILRVLASAGLSLDSTWFDWSTLVYPKTSGKKICNKVRLLFIRVNPSENGRAVCHMSTWLTVTVSACVISLFQSSGK